MFISFHELLVLTLMTSNNLEPPK